MFWGFSEAIDFYDEFKNYVNGFENNSEKTVNILLYGCADPRHIIKTIAKSYLHNISFNFYVIEGCPSLIARHMLLTVIPLEPSSLLSLLAKTHLFMDVYGNIQIRASSLEYIISKGKHFIKCVTDEIFHKQMQPIFDLSNLKYIERDCIEQICDYWRDKMKYFHLDCLWKQRIQKHMKSRYDIRSGAYDWDLNMRLKDHGAAQICNQEYNYWRETGIAFAFPEYRQFCINKTFIIERPDKPNGNQYLGDIVNGPFCAFGLNCPDTRMLRSNYGENDFRATDVSERNIFEIMYEIQEQKPFDKTSFKEHKLGGSILDFGKTVIESTIPNLIADDEAKQFNQPLQTTDRIRIVYLSTKDSQNFADCKKFEGFFDGIFVGRDYFNLIKTEFTKILVPDALVYFETLQLSTEHKDKIAEALKKIRNMAKEMELKSITNFNLNRPIPVTKYQMNRDKPTGNPEKSDGN